MTMLSLVWFVVVVCVCVWFGDSHGAAKCTIRSGVEVLNLLVWRSALSLLIYMMRISHNVSDFRTWGNLARLL